MKLFRKQKITKIVFVSLFAFSLGILLVSIFSFDVLQVSKVYKTHSTKINTVQKKEVEDTEIESKNEEVFEEFKYLLNDIWRKEKKYKYLGYIVSEECADSLADNDCKLTVKRTNKILAQFVSSRKEWIEYGFFDFLGKKDKQLIVYEYAGGANCCYEYTIYDLQPKFRKIYDSREFDSANEIGSKLIPIDINKDGIYEFTQSVMAFDYMAPGGHATSTFPPAIFAYNLKTKKFELANKKFSNYILKKMKANIDELDDWANENEKFGTYISQVELDEIATRAKSLYLIYAGREKEGWKYFEENYNFEFKDKFRSDIKDSLKHDPTYKSIYLWTAR